VLEQLPDETKTFGKTTSRWTDFRITVGQPPEQQLLNEAGSG
jgi:hypothetical protein